MTGNLVPERKQNEKVDRDAIIKKFAEQAIQAGRSDIILEITGTTLNSEELKARESQFEKMTDKEREKFMADSLRETIEPLPDSLMYLLTGWFMPVEYERSLDQKPDWVDMDKFHRGQKFAQDHLLPLLYCSFVCLLALFTFDDGLSPLIFSNNSSTPYTALKRYISVAIRLRSWYTEDLWTTGNPGSKDIMVTKAMHAAANKKMQSSTPEEMRTKATIPNAWCPARQILLKDFSESCKAPAVGQCPYVVGKDNPSRPRGITPVDMSITQWSFVGLLTTNAKDFGIHDATDEDLEAFCHLWKCIGYQLGMQDDYNFCRGTLDEIRQRSRDVVNSWIKPNFREITPEWEHMGRCVISGMSFLFPFITYEAVFLHFLDILEVKTPRLRATLSYKNWITYNILTFLNYYLVKIPGVSRLLNIAMNYILDRVQKFTPKNYENLRIKVDRYYEKNLRAKGTSISVSS